MVSLGLAVYRVSSIPISVDLTSINIYIYMFSLIDSLSESDRFIHPNCCVSWLLPTHNATRFNCSLVARLHVTKRATVSHRWGRWWLMWVSDKAPLGRSRKARPSHSFRVLILWTWFGACAVAAPGLAGLSLTGFSSSRRLKVCSRARETTRKSTCCAKEGLMGSLPPITCERIRPIKQETCGVMLAYRAML